MRGPRRNVLYINECNNLTFETYHQLAIRTSGTIWLDFNPSNEFWAYTECKEDEDTEWLTLTYRDNEGLPDSIKREIEKALIKGFINPNGNIHDEKNIKNKFWANWWKVYGLGMLGSLEGVIFGNWEIIKDVPDDAVFVGSGNDFGYTNDPTAIVDIYIWGNKRILDERCYKNQLLNNMIADVLNTSPKPPIVYADSAEPKSIAEIKKHDVNIHPVMKGKDSIMFGIQIMQQQDYLVTERSVNLIKELRQYCWDVDKNGVKLNKPAGGFDHCFVGETKVITLKGEKRIDEVRIGDLILTSDGYKPLIKKWDNGYKPIENYSLQFGTLIVNLTCTPDHRIKTKQGWKKISQLRSGTTVYLSKLIEDCNLRYTLKNDISSAVQRKCIKLYGKRKTGKKHLRDFTYTTKMKILGITNLKTLNLKNLTHTYGDTESEGIVKIQNGPKYFMRKASRRPRNGMQVKKEQNGMPNMQKNIISENGIYQKKNAKYVQKYLSLKSTTIGFAQEHAKLNLEGYQKSMISSDSANFAEMTLLSIDTVLRENVVKNTEKVYDLMVADEHEYYANGVLVHNCIDAVRYHEMMAIGKKKRKGKFGWGKSKPEPEEEPEVSQEAIEMHSIMAPPMETIDDLYDMSDLI